MRASSDPYHLQRFVDAQGPVLERAIHELRQGCKESHWMWFIFPQLKSLGRSHTALEFGISSPAEAEAYLRHPVLGPRLIECTRLVTLVQGLSIREIFGEIDAMKFHSCATLFDHATPRNAIFRDALEKYFEGQPDPLTLRELACMQ